MLLTFICNSAFLCILIKGTVCQGVCVCVCVCVRVRVRVRVRVCVIIK